MRFLRRIAAFLGLGKEDCTVARDVKEHEKTEKEDENQRCATRAVVDPNPHENGVSRKGFSIPVRIPVNRPQAAPVIVPCNSGDGGVQGLRWYAKLLRIDGDGDVADEFLEEVPSGRIDTQCDPIRRFKMQQNTRTARIRRQRLTSDGKIQHYVEYQRRWKWV